MNALTSADFAASSALRVGVLEVGARKFGLDIKNLAEICVIQKVLPLLSGRPDVLGAIDLRGNIIPLLDPLALCQAGGYDGMPELAAIVQHEGRLIALGIDRALSISDFDGSDVQQLYKTDHNSTIPIRSGLLSEKTNINLLEPARIFAQPDMPSRSATHERAKDTALGGSRAFLTFEAGGAAFGLEAIQIYGTVPRQNIEVSTMTGGDCLGEISYLNRRVPIMDATRVLGLGDRLRRTQPEIVVVNFPDGHLLGLAVDVIQQIRMIRNAELVEVNGLLAEAGSLFSYVLTRASGGQVFILNPERLVQQEALLKMSTLSDKPKAKAQVKAEESAAMVAGTNDVVRTQQRCLVFTGGLRVCAKITDVVSILPMPETLTPYVGPSPAILGLFPFEKRAVPLVSMALSLGRPKSEPGVMNRVLLVGEPDSRVGFMVDVVDGIETSEYIAAADQKSTISTRVAKLRNKEIKGLLPFLDLEQRARSLSTHSLEPH